MIITWLIQLQVIVVGAGLGGLGAAISILLAGHDILVLESASEIAEVPFPFPSPKAYT
jgi:cation diffusion facilitator CzcD-associated flavoprotein CzcO